MSRNVVFDEKPLLDGADNVKDLRPEQGTGRTAVQDAIIRRSKCRWMRAA